MEPHDTPVLNAAPAPPRHGYNWWALSATRLTALCHPRACTWSMVYQKTAGRRRQTLLSIITEPGGSGSTNTVSPVCRPFCQSQPRLSHPSWVAAAAAACPCCPPSQHPSPQVGPCRQQEGRREVKKGVIRVAGGTMRLVPGIGGVAANQQCCCCLPLVPIGSTPRASSCSLQTTKDREERGGRREAATRQWVWEGSRE